MKGSFTDKMKKEEEEGEEEKVKAEIPDIGGGKLWRDTDMCGKR